MEAIGSQPTTPITEQFAPETISAGLPWRLSIFAIIVFSLSLMAYFGLRFGYQATIERTIESTDTALEELARTVSKEEQDKFLIFYSQILNLKTALEKRLFISSIFPLIEKYIVNTVYFTSAQVAASDRTLTLQGVAFTFDDIAQQIGVFERASEIQSVSISGLRVQVGSVLFTLTLTIKPEALSKHVAL